MGRVLLLTPSQLLSPRTHSAPTSSPAPADRQAPGLYPESPRASSTKALAECCVRRAGLPCRRGGRGGDLGTGS